MFTVLMRRHPFDDLFALNDQLTRAWSAPGGPGRGTSHEWGQVPGQGVPPVDVRTDDDGWRLRVAVPGIAPEDVDVQVAHNRLQIRALERNGDQAAARYERTITVPDAVDLDRIGATCRHGMLEVHLPFKEAIRPRRIAVSSEPARQLPA